MPGHPPQASDLSRLARLLADMPPLPRLVFERHRYKGITLDQMAVELRLELRDVERLLADAMVHLDRGTHETA